ncbi:MAG: glycosyltransferase family 39 protein [Methanobacteriaceae archaeon]
MINMIRMKLKSLLKSLKSNKSLIYPLILLIFISIVTGLLIFINSTENILGTSYRDVYFYLIGGLRFAGYNITGYEYISYLSPLVPFLTSILFRLGIVSEFSIFFVTGLFFIIGTMGMYFLLRLRFNENNNNNNNNNDSDNYNDNYNGLSNSKNNTNTNANTTNNNRDNNYNNLICLFGAILYCSLSINLLWAADGTIDIPSVALSIWAIYFTILGTKKNQNYFFIAFPLGTLAFFAKFTGALVILLMLFYIIIVSLKETQYKNTWNPIILIRPYLKKTVIGGIFGVIVAIPFGIYYYINQIPLAFLTQAEEVAETATLAEPALIDQLSYFVNLPRLIYGPNHLVSYLILIIMVIGIAILLGKFILFLKNKYIEEPVDSFANKIFSILLGISLVGLLILLLATFSKVSFVYTEGLFFLIMVIFYILFNRFGGKNFNYDLLMFSWFFSYMIFFSIHAVKVDRYFTPMAPAFAFFGALSLDLILKTAVKPLKLKTNLNKTNLKQTKILKLVPKIVPVALIIFLMITSFGYLTIDKSMPLVQNEKDASGFLKEYDLDYSSKIIWADRGPIFTWHLQKEVKYTDWRYGSEESSDRFDKEINEGNVSYYFALRDIPIPNYKVIGEFDDMRLYAKA